MKKKGFALKKRVPGANLFHRFPKILILKKWHSEPLPPCFTSLFRLLHVEHLFVSIHLSSRFFPRSPMRPQEIKKIHCIVTKAEKTDHWLLYVKSKEFFCSRSIIIKIGTPVGTTH